MKIGAFAKTFNTKKSTIRYYTDINLLLPDNKGTYPEYNEACKADMIDIIRLKDMGFTIEEIHDLKVLERFYVNFTETNINTFHGIFDSKIQKHKEQIVKLEQQIVDIENFKKIVGSNKMIKPLGLDINLLQFLSCSCGHSFKVDQASIQDTSILSGILKCECGISYPIENGIIQPSSKKRQERNRDKQYEAFDFINSLGNHHLAQIKKIGQGMSEIIATWDKNKPIVFINADLDLLMMGFDDLFHEDGKYFFCASSYDGLMILKSKMELQKVKGHISFIHYHDRLPIKSSDLYIVDNVGNLLDYVQGNELGTDMLCVNHLFNRCEEYLLAHFFNNNIFKTAIDDHVKSFFLEKSYIQLLNGSGLTVTDEIEVGEFNYFKGMLPEIENIDVIKMKIKRLKPKTPM